MVWKLLEQPLAPQHATALLVLTALLWSTSGFLVKLIDWYPVNIAAVRSLFALPIVWLVVRKVRFTVTPLQLGAAFAYAGTVVLFVLATKLTTAANAIVLQYSAPIYVAALSAPIVGEKLRRFDWISVLVVCAGMVLFFCDRLAPGHLLGNVLGIASGICFGLTALLLRKQKQATPLESILLGNGIAVLLCLPFLHWSPPPSTDWLPLLLLGIFQLGIPYVFYSLAIRSVTALEAVLIPMLEPLMNPVWTYLAVGELPGPYAIAGAAVVLGMLGMRALWQLRSPSLAAMMRRER